MSAAVITEKQLREWERVLKRVVTAHNATVVPSPSLDVLYEKNNAIVAMEEAAVRAFPSLIIEVRRLRKASR